MNVVQAFDGKNWWISVDGFTFVFSGEAKKKQAGHTHEGEDSGEVFAPMTGTIIELCVKNGDVVEKRDLLLKMEAMKMQYSVLAPVSGTIERLSANIRDVVNQDDHLLYVREEKAK